MTKKAKNRLPIEVKSGRDYKKHSALNNCMSNSEYNMKEAFVFSNCNIQKEGKITYLPVYMTGFLTENKETDLVIEDIDLW